MHDVTFYAEKGGSGCTTVALAYALELASDGENVLFVNRTGHRDLGPMLGLPGDVGAAPWINAAPGLTINNDPDNDAWIEWEGPVVIDAGTDHYVSEPGRSSLNVLVIQPCFLALSRQAASGIIPSLVAVVSDPERSLEPSDVAAVVDAPAVEIPRDAAVARAIDAGLFGVRRPRQFAENVRSLVDAVATLGATR